MSMWKRCDACQYTQSSFPTDSSRYCQSCGRELIRWTVPPPLPQGAWASGAPLYHGQPYHGPQRSSQLTQSSWSSPNTDGGTIPAHQPYLTAEHNAYPSTHQTPLLTQQSQPASSSSAAASVFVDGVMHVLNPVLGTYVDQDIDRRPNDYTDDNDEDDYDDYDNYDDHDDESEQFDPIPEYWDDETESNIPEGEIRPKVFEGEWYRRRRCGEEHPTEMHNLMWHFQEVWTPKHTGGVASQFFCNFCKGRRGPYMHSHTTEDHNKGEWRDHPDVDFWKFTQSRRYAHFANPWYQFYTVKRPFPMYYYDPDNFDLPPGFPPLADDEIISNGMWYGTPGHLESLQESLDRALQSEAYSDGEDY